MLTHIYVYTAMTNVAHFYLDGRHASQTSQLSALVSKDKKASLDSYVYEALRTLLMGGLSNLILT